MSCKLNNVFIAMLVLGCATLLNGQENVRGNIPQYLIDCYRQDNLNNRDHRFAMTMSTLISLIRKVEVTAGANLDIRTLTTTLLHRFRMDGIERNPNIVMSEGVTPYRPSGRQFNKHKILFKQLIQGDNHLFPNGSLSLSEQCALHFMLSSSVDPWERGNEREMCPMELNDGSLKNSHDLWKRQKLTRDPKYPLTGTASAQLSRCPIEEGIILTSKWGTISAGTLLAGIAAGLEHQQVKIAQLLTEPTDEERRTVQGLAERYQRYQMLSESEDGLIDNIWAATLAGDLAEVAVWQGPRLQQQEGQVMMIGPGGRWNSTYWPQAFYMEETNQGFWEMTDAETRGGADGLLLGSEIRGWNDQLQRLKLSQVLEMYYSDRGVNFDPSYRACTRREKLRIHVTPTQLLTQTSNFARVLSFQMGNVHIEDDRLKQFCEMSVRAALDHESELLTYQQCGMIVKRNPKVHLTVILDGTWLPYDALELLSYLAEEADVSHYGSSMSVINGKTGNIILEKTHSTSDLFENVTTKDTTWPIGLDLGASLSKVYDIIDYEMAEERRLDKIGGVSHVVLVLACTSTITNDDFERSKEKVEAFKENIPDVRILYLTSDLNKARFEELLIPAPNANGEVLESNDHHTETVVPLIVHSLSQIPGRLMSMTCSNGIDKPSKKTQFEDYVLPLESKHYRIHPQYLGSNEIKIWVRGSGYGSLGVCLLRDIEDPFTSNCTKDVEAFEQIEYVLVRPCGNTGSDCQPIYLTITGKDSLNKCAEDDCRFPNQVRFTILHEGLNCVTDVSTGQLSSARPVYYTSAIFYLTQLIPILMSLILLRN